MFHFCKKRNQETKKTLKGFGNYKHTIIKKTELYNVL